jgi:hypothetical protein
MSDTIQIRNVDPLSGGKVEISTAAPASPSASYSVVVRRGTARDPFLGPDGWQQVEYCFAPVASRVENDWLILTFGSDLVDNVIRIDDVVDLAIHELDRNAVVSWSGITRSVTLTTPAAANPIPPLPMVPLPNTETPPPSSTPPRSNPAEASVSARSPFLWLLPFFVLLLCSAAGIAYWFLWRSAPTAISYPVDPAATLLTEVDPETPAPVSLVSAYERGVTAFAAGDCDTARVALQEAVTDGSGPALLFWAEQQDSLEFKECLTQSANDIRALDYYKRACAADMPDVSARLTVFQVELQRRADEGDITASEVLRVAFPAALTACQG